MTGRSPQITSHHSEHIFREGVPPEQIHWPAQASGEHTSPVHSLKPTRWKAMNSERLAAAPNAHAILLTAHAAEQPSDLKRLGNSGVLNKSTSHLTWAPKPSAIRREEAGCDYGDTEARRTSNKQGRTRDCRAASMKRALFIAPALQTRKTPSALSEATDATEDTLRICNAE